MTEDEMFGWHHQLNRIEFEQTLGESEGQGNLACYSPWGCKELDTTEWLNNIKRGYNSKSEKQATQLKKGKKTWVNIFPKTYRWSAGSWKKCSISCDTVLTTWDGGRIKGKYIVTGNDKFRGRDGASRKGKSEALKETGTLCVCSVARPYLTLCNPVNYHPPGSSVHGIFESRILEWVAIFSCRGSSRPRDRTHVSCISCFGRRILYLPLSHLGHSVTKKEDTQNGIMSSDTSFELSKGKGQFLPRKEVGQLRHAKWSRTQFYL